MEDRSVKLSKLCAAGLVFASGLAACGGVGGDSTTNAVEAEPSDEASAPGTDPELAEPDSVLIVSGRVRLDDRTVEFAPTRTLPLLGDSPPANEPGPFRIDVIDHNGILLVSADVELDQIVDSDQQVADFSASMPVLNRPIAEIIINLDDVEIGRVTGTASVPTVTIEVPSPGQTTVDAGSEFSWLGQDLESTDLYYTVLLSTDSGQSWSSILSSSNQTSVRPSSRMMTKSEAALLLVAVSDGVNGSYSISSPFAIP